ncbi:peptidase M14 [Fulvitalea axinellae]|uniref:Peptidase M14 n=1 Tax=Fulvitalea axinellae TaxID=1182444 RepID=A0AAU9CNA4_9BACT|nr:peptidase M14 [Fulvitalea axinellae]
MGRRLAGVVTLFILWVNVALGQSPVDSPSEFLGYDLGDRFTPHYRVVEYFRHVAKYMPSHVKLKEYGHTYEGRPLILAFVGSSEKIQNIEDIRRDNLIRAGIKKESLVRPQDTTALVWLSYNVHGNEASSSEAAMKTLHSLTNSFVTRGNNSEVWHENTLVIIDPCLNPDGRDRYVNWQMQKAGFPNNTALDAVEHHEPWPGGRTNHYLFDLNRDWSWQTQEESRARVTEYNRWLPQVHVDFHEQGVDSPYYFAPAAEPLHEDITAWQKEFQRKVGEANAKVFDKHGWLYFTGESFDLLYPGYGDTYPTYNGAIGMTYEQAGHTTSSTGVDQENGNILKLSDRIEHHYASGLATVRVSAENAPKLVTEFQRYFRESETSPKGKYKAYVVSGQNDPVKMEELVDLLDREGIRYGGPLVKKPVRGFDYRFNKSKEAINLHPGDLVISAYQPKSRMLKILFEPRTFVADSVTYDITAWSIPYAYDLDAWAITNKMFVSQLPPKFNKPREKQVFRPDAYAYVVEWKNIEDARLLAEVLGHGVKVRYARKPFAVNGKNYKAGTVIISREDNRHIGEALGKTIWDLNGKYGDKLRAVDTGFTEQGIDFGSSSMVFGKSPKVALLGGQGIDPNRFGELWHYFERNLAYPVTVLDTDYFAKVNLDSYDVLILPDGYYSSTLGGNGSERIRDWVSDGGKLIAIQGAVEALVSDGKFGLKEYMDKSEEDKANKRKSDLEKADLLAPYAGRERRWIRSYLAGAIYKVRLDNTHPLAYGYPTHYFTMKTDSHRVAYLEDGWNVATIGSSKDLVSGFVGSDIKPLIGETLVAGVMPMGRGKVVCFVDDPVFRGFWKNGELMLANAIFMVGN